MMEIKKYPVVTDPSDLQGAVVDSVLMGFNNEQMLIVFRDGEDNTKLLEISVEPVDEDSVAIVCSNYVHSSHYNLTALIEANLISQEEIDAQRKKQEIDYEREELKDDRKEFRRLLKKYGSTNVKEWRKK